jgi:hypothetical protein
MSYQLISCEHFNPREDAPLNYMIDANQALRDNAAIER